ncbi:MAG: dihydropteroate synthase [Flavobacteriales bacterium]|nr:dihydropteroate synthase [Flavobacteriales bacterium]
MVMGIVNITPDSFYDGGRHKNIEGYIQYIEQIINEGVDIIDLGACSSRPGAKPISLKEEETRLLPVLEKIKKEFPHIPVSIDTYRYQIAEKAILCGAQLINDIYVEKDKQKMFSVIAKHNTPYVLMHMQGNPENMQKKIHYIDFQTEIMDFFKNNIKELNQMGVNNILLDPGFGFGKTLNQNYSLINMISRLKQLNYPILTGLSRKSMISQGLNTTPKNALTGTIAANTICLMNGVNIIRVHDVKEAKETIKIFNLTQINN